MNAAGPDADELEAWNARLQYLITSAHMWFEILYQLAPGLNNK